MGGKDRLEKGKNNNTKKIKKGLYKRKSEVTTNCTEIALFCIYLAYINISPSLYLIGFKYLLRT
jgi:hypothetical protein